jgi:TonB-dependent receptor
MNGAVLTPSQATPLARSVLAHAAWIALMSLAWPLQAQAQQATSAAAATLPTVTVTGQAAGVRNALDVQQAADNVVSAVRSDDIGQLPDRNAAEALQRLPGVSVERDQGEGRYVRIRGLGPDFNAVTFNGSLIPAPEADRRAVALDVLPASLVRSIEVSKTLTPDMDANSLGGTVNVKTLSAFDHKGRFLSLETGLFRDTNTDRTSPNAALTWSDRFMDGKLGIAAGISHDVRKFGSDNVEASGWTDDGELEGFERRDYRITRERTGLALNLDYRPTKGESYYLRSLHTRFSDDEVRQAHAVEGVEDADEEIIALQPGVPGEVTSVRELKARKETQKVTSIVLGTERELAGWGLHAALGMSRASETMPRSIAGAVFEGTDSFTGVGFTNTRSPRLFSGPAIHDASQYVFKEAELSASRTSDKEANVRLDLSRKTTWLGHPGQIKLGGKVSRRTKTSNEDVWLLERDALSASDEDLALSHFSSGAVQHGLGTFGPGVDPASVRALVGDQAELLEGDSQINDYRMKERIQAAYAMGTVDVGLWRVLAGLRWERTRFDATGTGDNDGTFESVQARKSYDDWLPALHLRRDLDDDTSIRAALTRSVVRPTFGQLAPGFQIDGDEAEFGNPELKPLRSNNFDLGIEHRFGPASVVSAYGFYKDINNFAYRSNVAGSGLWAGFDEAVTFRNGDRSKLVGLELAYTHAFKSLPAPWNGLLASANLTLTHSKATIRETDPDTGEVVSRRISLPSQSDRVLNLAVGYEAHGWSIRLAANHKSDYLYEVQDVQDRMQDLTVRAQTQFDLSVAYALNKQMQVVFEGINLNDSKYYVYQGQASRNAQYETYGPSYRLGLRVTLD